MSEEIKKKKILLAITKASPFGGSQKYVYEIATAAAQTGFNVAVAFGMPGELDQRLQEAGVRTIEISALGRDVSPLRDFASFKQLVHILQAERPDVLHLNSSKIGCLGALAGRLTGVPTIIFTAHGWAFNERRPWWQKGAIALFHWFTVLLAHKTLCNSYATKRDIARLPWIHRKLDVIHLGIETPTFKERISARNHLLPNKVNAFWIGMVGELHTSKGFTDALEAFTSITADHQDAIMVIVGEGSERANLEVAIHGQGLSHRAFLLGYIRDAAQYLKAFDMFILPSHTESFGLALVEAGFAGLPTIATRVGGIPEIIQDGKNGLLVPPNDTQALTQALAVLMKDSSLRNTLGSTLKESATHQFSKEKMVRETLAYYL